MTQTQAGHAEQGKHKKGEETAGRLLEAALALFVEQGYAGTSVPQIAQRAGVSTGLLYYHFANKEALANALYQRWKGAMGEHMRGDLPSELPYRAKFREVFMRLTRFAQVYPDAFNLLELHHHSYLDAASLEARDAAHQPFIALLERGVAQGLIKPLPLALLSAAFVGVFTGAWRAALDGTLVLDDAALDALERLTWEGLRA